MFKIATNVKFKKFVKKLLFLGLKIFMFVTKKIYNATNKYIVTTFLLLFKIATMNDNKL